MKPFAIASLAAILALAAPSTFAQINISNGADIDMNGSTGSQIIFPDGSTIGSASDVGAPPGHGGTNNTVSGTNAIVGGGSNNSASATTATVGGGESNAASSAHTTIGGGINNTANDWAATVAGGEFNTAGGYLATVAGGGQNNVTDEFGTISGGYFNQAGDNAGTQFDAPYATVSGGFDNTASGSHSTIGGGNSNTVTGFWSTAAGGHTNTANGNFATIAGGVQNTTSFSRATVSGGGYSTASAEASTVGGGHTNVASGQFSTVPGGSSNTAAGDYSFAAGRRAKVNAAHDGAFLFADQTNVDFNSAAANEFAVRATGGVRFVTAVDGTGGTVHAITMDSNGNLTTTGSVNPPSDRNMKENFACVDSLDVLDKVASLPIATWNYKQQDAATRHMGVTAQDFAEAFGLGDSDKHISTVDADGVALAAIQGLHRKHSEELTEKQKQIDQLHAKNAELEARLAAIEQKLAD